MKLVHIFVLDNSEDGLWSIHVNGREQNEFDCFFDQMNDVEWLYNFFELNNSDLTSGYFGKMSVREAVLRTLQEVQTMEDTLYDFAEKGFSSEITLQHLFKPLNNFEYAIFIYQKSKARIRNGWLRLYAIRLNKNCYMVTGGAIKLTRDMKRSHLQNELRKLDLAKIFLRNHGIDFPEDLNNFEDE